MDHAYVEENQIADRYVMGTLPAEEAERFENHYLSCPECLDRLELTESVQRGFKRMAGQDAAQLTAAHQLAVVAWLARLGRMRQLGVLLAALLVLAVLPTGFAVRSNTKLAQAHSALKQERQRSVDAGTLQAELEASRRQLAGEHEARTRVEGQLAQAFQPRANVPIVSLVVERGEPEGDGPAVHPSASGWVLLEAPVEPPFQKSYRAVLRDGNGREVSRVPDLQPNERSTLSFSLPTALLPAGAYSVTIEPGGQRFNFRILPPG
ncbi:MAG TPA: zf-HC2 domain-containing protein [Thermoanaerobaculia bacterium]|jgi:anti-sigma factor RsiW